MKVRTHSGAALALVTLLGLLGAAPGARAVDYSGTLNSNTTWSAGDVVVVTGDLSVAPGITLTVNEGALVQVRGAYRLTVNGTLEVNGSQAAPAVFQPENAGAARGAWVGLVVEAGATVDLEHAILRKAQWGLQVNGLTASPVGVRQPEFSECSLGAVNVVSGAGARSATLDAVRVHHNGTNSGSSALYVGNGESLTVQNGLFYANTGNGLESYYGTLTATNCTVHGQTAYGLYLWYGTATVKNCIVSANSSNGIYTNGTSYSASYNDVWGNGNNGNAGSSSISANPLFVDAAGYDFGLTHRSPGRKLGEGGTWQGALEWAGAQTVGNLGYVWEDLTIPAGDFVIAGDFTVAPGVTLTVDPGAVLKFAAVDAMGSNDALAELRVEGTLNADGTLGEPIELRPESDGAARGSWTGVVALPGASFTLDSAVIRKAKVGLSCEAAGALVTQTEIADCTQNAVNVVSGAGARSATLDAVRVHHNGTNSGSSALYVGNGESLTVQNGLFYANTGNGLESYYGTLTATNCTVHGQTAYGLYLWYGTATVKNCIVSANSSNGIYTNGTSYSASYNDVWGNGNNGNAGSSSITEDPMFVNVVEPNLHLLDSSPCIDTGTATGAPDHDLEGQPRPLQGREVGSPIHDMGAYEFNRTSNRYPVADAGADRTVVKDAPVQFDGSPSVDPDGSVVAWAWDFGDGQLGSGATPIHTYATAGTYQVTLVVTDDGGLTGSDRASIHVNTRPTAAAGPDKNAAVNETVYFDASGSADVDGSLVGFLWDFGDGQTATTSFASHRYASSGLYTATLTVTDDDGASASDTARVTVGDPADTTGPVVIHTQVPDGQPDGVDVAVVATISDESGVRSASLYYRPTGQPGFSAAPMVVVAGSQYAGLIPAAAVTTAGVDYYLEAEDDSPAHNPSLSPAGGAGAPYHFGVVAVDRDPPSIAHTPVGDGQPAGQPVSVTAEVTDETGIALVRLWYRVAGAAGFTSVELIHGAGDSYQADIPAGAVTAAGVDYYLEAADTAVPVHAGSLPDDAPASYFHFTVTAADTAAPSIQHTPVADGQPEGLPVRIAATLTDPSGVGEARLFYLGGGAVVYTELALSAVGGDVYEAEIPAAAVTYPRVSYYLEAVDQAATPNQGSLPAGAPAEVFTFAVSREVVAEPGDVIVSEIMADTSLSEPSSEWFELTNTTDADIDLTGWVVADLGQDSFEIGGPGPVVIPAGGTLVLGRSADLQVNGGVGVDYVYAGLILANSADELVLLAGATEVDRVAWDRSAGWPLAEGRSLSLDPAWLDASANDLPEHWCQATTPLPGGDTGTPGEPNDSCGAGVDEEGPAIAFTPIADGQPAGQDVLLDAVIADPSGLASATCFYRLEGAGSWAQADFALVTGDLYQAVLPGASMAEPGVDYYVVAVDASPNQNLSEQPAGGAAAALHFTVDDTAIDTQGPSITHQPVAGPVEAGTALELTALVSDPSGVDGVRVLYRALGAADYSALELQPGPGAPGVYLATLPAGAVQVPGVQYYLEATDASPASNSSAFPVDHATAPITFQVVDSSDRIGPDIAHTPVAGPVLEGTPVEIEAEVTDPSGVAEVTLFYKGGLQASFTALTCSPDGDGTYRASIPAAAVLQPAVLYYLEAVDGSPNQNASLEPADGALAPRQFLVEEDVSQDSDPPVITDVHALADPAVAGLPVTLAATIADPSGVASAQVFLRTRGSGLSFVGVALEAQGGDAYQASVPGALVELGVLEYYVEARDASALQNLGRAPADAPTTLYALTVEDGEQPPASGDGCGCGAAGAGGLGLLGLAGLALALLRRRR